MARSRHPQPFPWEVAHATPQDQALGLELELIELVRRRRELGDGHPASARLDGEIDRTIAELDDLVEHLPVAV